MNRVRFRRRDDGATTTELVLGMGVVMLLVSLAVFVGRGTSAAVDVANAAGDAARAASLAASPAAATRAARTTAAKDLTAAASACRHPRTEVNTGEFRAGGRVSVTVTCTVALADIPIAGITSRTVRATATEPIDVYKVVTG